MTDQTACDICGRADIIDGDEPGMVHDDAHPHGVMVCSVACTEEAVRVMTLETDRIPLIDWIRHTFDGDRSSGQRHHGPLCPDGLVMCCMCFKRVTRDRLHVLESGDGLDVPSAPIYEDVCRTCKERETRWGVAVRAAHVVGKEAISDANEQ